MIAEGIERKKVAGIRQKRLSIVIGLFQRRDAIVDLPKSGVQVRE